MMPGELCRSVIMYHVLYTLHRLYYGAQVRDGLRRMSLAASHIALAALHGNGCVTTGDGCPVRLLLQPGGWS